MKPPTIHIITGARHEGKTGFTHEAVAELQRYPLQVRGFLSVGHWEDQNRTSYSLLDISGGKHYPLCQRGKISGWIDGGTFYFHPDTVALGSQIISQAILESADILVIDEVGLLETRGLIWSDSINKILYTNKIPQIWTVRDSHLEKVIDFFQMKNHLVYNINDLSPVQFAETIVQSLR